MAAELKLPRHAKLVRRLSVHWGVPEKDLRSHFDDSVTERIWQMLINWNKDYPLMTFEASLALFEAKASQRRSENGHTHNTKRASKWQPCDITASRREVGPRRSSPEPSPTSLLDGPWVEDAGLRSSILIAKIRKYEGWQNFPRCLPEALHLENEKSYTKLQAFNRLAQKCGYQTAEALLVDEHRKTFTKKRPSSKHLSCRTIFRVAKMIRTCERREVGRSSTQDSLTAHTTNATLHRSTALVHRQSSAQISCQTDSTSLQDERLSTSPFTEEDASAMSEPPTDIQHFSLPLPPRASSPRSDLSHNARADIDPDNTLPSARLDALDDLFRLARQEYQSQNNTGLLTPPTSSPDIDESKHKELDAVSSGINPNSSVPREVTYSEGALLHAISVGRRSFAGLDLKVRQDFEVLAEFVLLVLKEGPIDLTKETLRSAIAVCHKGFQSRSQKVRSDLQLICNLVTDVMNQEDVSVEWDVDELDYSDDDVELQNTVDGSGNVMPTAGDNKLRRKAYDAVDDEFSIDDDHGARLRKKRRMSDNNPVAKFAQANSLETNVTSGLDLLYQAVMVRKFEQPKASRESEHG